MLTEQIKHQWHTSQNVKLLEKKVLYTGIKRSCKYFLPLTYPHFLIESQSFFLQFLCKGNGKKTNKNKQQKQTKKITKKEKSMINFLNSTIVKKMHHIREHAVVTRDRYYTMIHDKIAIKAKELNSKFHPSNKST